MQLLNSRRVAAGAAALALAAGGGILTGCGSDSPSAGATTRAAAGTTDQAPNGVEKLPAKQILDVTRAIARAESSVRVRGTSTDEAGARSSLDVQVGDDAGQGTISIGPIRMELRRVDGTTYYRINAEDFGRIVGTPDNPDDAKALAALLNDNWIREGADDGLAAFAEFLQKDPLLKGLLTPGGTPAVKGTDTVDGTPVVLISDGATGVPVTLAVSTVGPPLPVQVAETGSEAAVMRFSDWGAPVSVTAPTNVIGPEDFERLVQERVGSASG